jgi:hypothetical protein
VPMRCDAMDHMRVKMRKVRTVAKAGTVYEEIYESYDFGGFGRPIMGGIAPLRARLRKRIQ